MPTRRELTRFREQVLTIMEQKHHWAWPHFADGRLTKPQMKIHFQQEYAVYVRDFPVFLARIHGANPPADVRRRLAENIYEEDTGGLSLGRSHPSLFLEMMAGVGYRRRDFESIRLLPASRTYRRWLDTVSAGTDWVVSAAVLTIFVEGSVKDRQELTASPKPKTEAEIEALIAQHPLVRHHGVSPDAMNLIRAHQRVESGHRHDAYEIVLAHAATRSQRTAVIKALEHSLALWLRYRDGVARACRLTRNAS